MALLPGEPPHADDVAPRGTKEWRRAVDAHRAWVGEQLWTQQATNNLNLSDPEARAKALSNLNINPEKGGGLHAYNLFMGNLPTEGFGMSSSRDIPYAMEAYMPDWRFNLDRAIQGGMSRTDANLKFLPQGAPGSAGYPSGGTGTAGTASASWSPGGPTMFGPGSTSGPGYGGVPLSSDEDEWKRKRLTLGGLADWGA